MTVRTKQGLAAEYGTLFPTAGDPKITAAELRSFDQDLIDSLSTQAALDALAARVTALEGGGGGPASHSLYVGWSDDRLIATADLTAAADADDVSVAIPARATNGYLFVATLETNGSPSSLVIGTGRNQIGAFPQQTGTVNDAGGDAHLVFVSSRLQAPGIAGLTLTIAY